MSDQILTVKAFVEQTGELPTSFTQGKIRYELYVSEFKGKQKGWQASYWKMAGPKKDFLICIKHGATEEAAKQNLKNYIISKR